MSDLEQRLRAFPGEFPRPSEQATRRARTRLGRPAPPAPPRRRWSTAAVLAAALVGGLLVGAASMATATDSDTSAVDDPTIFARFHTRGQYKTKYFVLYGRVPSGAGDEVVEVLERSCGFKDFRVYKSARTVVAGFWELPESPVYGSATYVARWKGRMSDELNLRTSLYVLAFPARRAPRFVVRLYSRHQEMKRRLVYIQRRVGEGSWTTIRRLRLRQGSNFGSYEAPFIVRQRGLTLRAFVPLTSARPCHDAEASNTFKS
jgi:hypothetical protein